MNNANKDSLVARIERCIDDGIVRLTKQNILSFCKYDIAMAAIYLKQWETEGKLKILKLLDQASDDENVVEMITYITRPVIALRYYNVEQFERILIGRINQFKKYDILTRHLILDGLEHCLDVAKVCLEKWQREGKCQILKPLDQAKADDEVIKLLTLTHIEGKTPWMN